MKGSHFVIYIGMCSSFQAPSKLGHGWKQRSYLLSLSLSLFFLSLTLPPFVSPPSPLSSSLKGSVSFLFDVRRMHKAICNIYMRVY